MKYIKELAEIYRTLDLIDLNIEIDDKVQVEKLLLGLRLQIATIFKRIENDFSKCS